MQVKIATKIVTRSFENVLRFKYLGRTVTNQNLIQEKIKRRLNFGTSTSAAYWSEFLATDPEVLCSIPGATRLSEKWWFWKGVHSAS
jgi:hypothetical protein